MKNTSYLNLAEKALKLSLQNIWRNKFLSIATIFVIGIIIFIFNTILAVNFIAKDAITELTKKIDIVLYLKEGVSFEQSQALISDLTRIEGIEKITYTSKDDAITQISQAHPDISLAFEKYNLGNPLPASINVKTTDPKYHASIEGFIQSNARFSSYLSNITSSNLKEQNSILTSVSTNLEKLSTFTQQTIFWLVITFIIGGTLIILNALQITIFHRKKEITIMKLVGASHWFIRLPYIIEAIIYGVLAVAISLVMLLALSQKIQIKDTNLFSYYSNIEFYKIFIIETVVTITLSIFSAIIAVHEHLIKKRI